MHVVRPSFLRPSQPLRTGVRVFLCLAALALPVLACTTCGRGTGDSGSSVPAGPPPTVTVAPPPPTQTPSSAIGAVGDSGYRPIVPDPSCFPFIWHVDRFSGTPLDRFWTWVPGTGGAYTLGDNLVTHGLYPSGALLMTAPANVDLFPGNTGAPRLVHRAGILNDGVGLAVRTSFVGQRGAYNGVGLVLWLDQYNYARLEFAQATAVPAVGIEFDVMDNGQLTRVAPLATTPFGQASDPLGDGRYVARPPIYLELITYHNSTVAAWSTDGQTWTQSAAYPRRFVGALAGLATINDGPSGDYWGIFDDFLNFTCNQQID